GRCWVTSRPRCRARSALPTSTRSAFIARKPDSANPNWTAVGLCFGTTAVLWVLVSISHCYAILNYSLKKFYDFVYC
uniref:NADH dehydrogenase [ubiquinone] 1 subunit C1, mitochondrial n=1 Tax=Pelusios castaneus TaxID=367368 RepID=A0A8C8RCN4_9SAUR